MKKQNKTSSRANVKIVISLIIAIVLWIYVIGDQDPRLNQRYNNIPVEIKNENLLNERDLLLISETEFSVDITVNGRTSALYNLPWRNIRASVDFVDIEDKGSYSLAVEIVGIPEDIDLISVSPAQVEIEVDRLSSQTRQIDIEFVGSLPEGISLLDYSINPQNALVEGGEELLGRIRSVGAALDITGETDEATKRVELKAFDADGNEISGVNISPREASVLIKIGKNSTANIVVQTTGEPAEGFSIKEITVDPANIEIGSDSDLEITEIKTEPIKIDGLDTDAQIRAELIFPQGVEPSTDISEVTVNIVVERIVEAEFEVGSIDIDNLGEGLVVKDEYLDEMVAVVVSGAQSVLENLAGRNLRIFADLRGYQPGQWTVDLKMEPIEKVALVSIQPGSIDLIVEEE
ncbi:CdaR family protein [Alkalibacter saccharofermentans]|uniref:YbbR domain-containing protein n=1 Tax=Alkalibacter saccharofermentans DSM 14828 TaxID=1120975 RepID=A0A1M4VT90_9FIRM|nr:CdaR family protein [Alkalibacter saccharofermentans]SHE72254.1 YbbR domain-containing protein [Alkalibacter saccharofermentans DSM 14828]